MPSGVVGWGVVLGGAGTDGAMRSGELGAITGATPRGATVTVPSPGAAVVGGGIGLSITTAASGVSAARQGTAAAAIMPARSSRTELKHRKNQLLTSKYKDLISDSHH